ncbi:MAG TPA: hypothetical protein DCX89_04285, partial [Saprospirales bacterium]|nr:hypothetical protein [Saprospirales bacterium]
LSSPTRRSSDLERGAGLPDTSITDTEGLDMKNKNTLRVLFSGNPGRAALYSLIFPGAGQAYNKKYWKIPLIYGALAGAGYYYYDINKKYKELKSLYQNDVLTHPNQSSNYFPYYLTQKKAREQAIFIIVGVHLFNSLEAYIDRHLIDFDTDENLSMEFKITPDPFSGAGISFYYTLK